MLITLRAQKGKAPISKCVVSGNFHTPPPPPPLKNGLEIPGGEGVLDF